MRQRETQIDNMPMPTVSGTIPELLPRFRTDDSDDSDAGLMICRARSKKLALAIGPVFTEKVGKAEDVDQRTSHETPARHSTVGGRTLFSWD
jgi:hypothetical protein